MEPGDGRRARALARANMPMRRVSRDDLDASAALPLDPSARVALVWEVTLDAWASSQLAMPEYERGDAPGVLVRGRDGAR